MPETGPRQEARERERLEEGADVAESHGGKQYSFGRILGIWALAAAPMGILSWIVFPAVSPDYRSDPFGAGVTRIAVLTVGLIWLFVLSLVIVRREEGDLRWATIKRRLRLNTPRDPGTGEPRRKLWLWMILLLIAIAGFDMALRPQIIKLWVSMFPSLAEPPGYGMSALFGSKEGMRQLVGAWWFLGLFVVNAVFNTVLGEEFLFRGVLLPKMEGVFGRWNWVANGLLHGFWHFHQPWGMAASAVAGVFLYAFPAWRFRSTWMGVAVHSAQSVYFAFLILGVVSGLA
jgi:membrane protease YdiL (CAAX protease family)